MNIVPCMYLDEWDSNLHFTKIFSGICWNILGEIFIRIGGTRFIKMENNLGRTK